MGTTPFSFGNLNNGQLALLGIGAGAGAVPTPSSTTGSSSYNQTSTPNLSPENLALLQQLGDQYSHLASTGTNLQPYQQQQEQNINTNANIASNAAQQKLAAQGLSNSPVVGAVQAQSDQNRIGQITNLQESIPLLSNELQQQNLNAATGFTASIPHGTTTSGTQNSTQQTQSGGGIGGFLGGLGKGLASILTLSDKNAKENIHDSIDGLEKVLKMKPKNFNYKGDTELHSGFVAQDLEHLFPEVVKTLPNGVKGVAYHELIPKIVSAIQEMHGKMGEMSKNTVQPRKGVTA